MFMTINSGPSAAAQVVEARRRCPNVPSARRDNDNGIELARWMIDANCAENRLVRVVFKAMGGPL
jgi:hypothetical protein